MNETARRRFRKTMAALVALGLVLSVLGPVGTVAAQPSVSVTQSVDSTTIAPGETVTITTEFTVSELNAPQLSATTPDGWEIESQSATGPVAYNDGTWTWLAGDDDGVNVSYTVEYTVSVPDDADPGEYTISADGSALSPSDSSATSDSATTTVTVAEPDENEPPTASFTSSPDSPETGEQVSFDASASTDDSAITSYEWDFDDGTTATGASATHTYDSAGDYDVTLTVTDDDGETDTATQTVSVGEAASPASFQLSALDVESPVTQGDTATVTATVENVGDESATQTVALEIDGTETDSQDVTLDGGASQQVSFDVDTTDLSTGDHDVTVSTEDDSASDTLAVSEEPPENLNPSAALDSSPSAPEPGETVTFDASASNDPDGAITSYEWDFDGDGTADATGEQVTTSFDSAGDYDVTLTVTDDDGETDTATQTVSVSEAPDGDGPATTVSLSPESDLVAVDQSTEYDVVVDDTDGGVGAYELTITVEDPSVASITGVDLAGVSDEELTDVQIADDGSSVTIEAVLVDTEDDGSATLGTVTVQANAEGTSDLSLNVSDLGTEAGESYDVTGTNGASLTASTLVVGNSENPAQDLDGDGDYEDINGDGTVDLLDVQTLFADRDGPAASNSPEAFDYNGDGEFTLSDIQALFAQEMA
ncbi:PKD domain-containing protein [Halorarum halophilum]|uniref:PKD domain-containing protein n=1 Tax=Halorarum halophilum TaxID=2743090 RepID=A0A7D5GB75_9EURY|nr:PKD domain-containing protein [Halobaculum halophilum]QLG27266.1 PKD domain-containing protein [Halobaculum halophilum]